MSNHFQKAWDYCQEYGHYGLIRNESEQTFKAANPFSLSDEQLPPVDVKTLPDSLGVADWMQIEDQQQLGACQGHARTSAEELAIYRETNGEIVQLNRMFAYVTSQMMDNLQGRDQGSTIDGGAKASQRYGSCLESIQPYTGKYTTRFSQECYTDGESRKLRAFKALQSYDQVLRWLVHGIGGIVIGIGWNASCEPDADGRITRYRSGGGGHALALLDWTKRFNPVNPDICMANSWSQRWGKNGWGYLSPSVVDYMCENETVIGYSDMDGAAIKPRPFKNRLWTV
jgi:C1A family cysteine protease